jgi:Domain of unknown function (DUF6799)
MKKIILVLTAGMFALSAWAQQSQSTQNPSSILAPSQSSAQWKDTYCASTRDGNIIVMNGKTELVVDMTLENGTKITTDGYVIKNDGTKTALKSGDCVDKNGNIIQSKNRKK